MKQSFSKAYDYYTQALSMKHPNAQKQIGLMIISCQVPDVKRSEGLDLIESSESSACEDAITFLKKLTVMAGEKKA